jgi:DNA mismatch repair protein MutS2
MNDKTLNTLEFGKVRERLAKYTSFSAGHELAMRLEPLSDIVHVRRNQRITTEAVRLLSLRPEVTIGGARDVRELVRRAELGSVLDPSDILQVLDTLRACRVLRDLIVRTAERGELDLLAFIADGITPLPKIEHEIERCINDDGQVLDSASPALGKIRANIRVAYNRLMAKLQQIISSESYARALQEPIITLRDGRYVVPVKRDFQGSLRGIVHDQSNTGSTLFVEPLATVDLGNEWRQLQLEETQEIERIMRELGALIASRGDAIRTNVEIVADIDLAFAKGRYSIATQSMEPDLVEPRPKGQAPVRPPDNRERRADDGRRIADESSQAQRQSIGANEQIQNRQSKTQNSPGLFFKNARHPLLTGTVVPITVELGTRFRMLVITGPNTGGKTVALKTVGLLSVMAMAGLHIPTDSGSRAVVFKDVYADIGDEQSIEQSLSTFSSHMSNIINILKRADRDCLILLDELGAGTDPQEGSALARSIITHILEIGALSVCTTHYSELKAFAFTTPGVENASVEFNVDTLSPTYRLMIGVPGRSNALAIARRLGLSHTIIDRARSFIDPDAQNVESLLEDIRGAREAARTEHGTAAEARREIDRRREELDRKLAEVEEIKARAAEEAHAETQRELQALRDELRRLRGRVEAGLAATSDETLTSRWVQEAQLRAQELDKQLATSASQQQKKARSKVQGSRSKVQSPTDKPHVLGPGDTVYVQSLGAEGDVLSGVDKAGQVEVQVGAFKMRVPAGDVRLRSTARAESAARDAANTGSMGRYAPTAPAAPPPLEYDFRGWRAEAAIEEMDRRLGEAALAGMPFLRVIHGKGTGALRKAMRDFFKSHPLVKEVETAPLEQGGEGVTIVKL